MALKGHLPKAYLRLDPNIDHTHPDVGAFVRLLCAALRQPKRGRFKSWSLVEAALGRGKARTLRDRGDLEQLDDGTWLVTGWDEWQEGDFTVAERMRAIRAKREGTEIEPLPGSVRTANWRLRTAVFERDHWTCRYCGNQAYERRWLVADHVIPTPVGPTVIENLVTACRPCNKRKGGRTPDEAGMPLLGCPIETTGDGHSDGHRDITVTPGAGLSHSVSPPPLNNPPSPSGTARQQGSKAGGDAAQDGPPAVPPADEAVSRALAVVGAPGELERLQAEVQAELLAACEAMRQPADVVLTRASRTSGGQVITNVANVTRVPWLRTTLDRLRGMRLSATADAAAGLGPAPRGRPSIADVSRQVFGLDEIDRRKP